MPPHQANTRISKRRERRLAREKSHAVLQKNNAVRGKTREQEEREAAEKALRYAKEGKKVESGYHAAKFIQYITQARYGGQEPLASLPIASVIYLTRYFKLSEWQTIERDPVLLSRTITHLQETHVELGNSQDCDWTLFWKTIQRINPDWGRALLLEINLALWGGDINGLTNSAMSLGRQNPPFSSRLGVEGPMTHQPVGHWPRTPNGQNAPEMLTRTTVLHRSGEPEPDFIPNQIPTSSLRSPCVEEYTTDWKRSQILQLLEGDSVNQTRVNDFDNEDVDSLYNISLGSSAMGLRLCDLDNVFAYIRSLVESSEGYMVERSLNLERTACLSMDIRVTGDCTIKLKVPRFDGVMLAQDHSLLQNFM
ncbi:hypothetical protein CDV31_016416 [Fusarium ambrosium]|uniref:Uncharacterized protein n=1 Tax=Fusarium ambrosium TaxID=131363 RepID=A0A428S913_9HYPO|nr:hypothetical protein CDV31_016416 [Fusarium ambrosium]